MGKTHRLKIWPEFYKPVTYGEVTSQLRKDDRDYQKGDDLILYEYDHKRDFFSGHTCMVHITDVLRNFEGLLPGYCVLSIKMSPSATRFRVEIVNKTAKEMEEELNYGR